jgi:hypothetical protein
VSKQKKIVVGKKEASPEVLGDIGLKNGQQQQEQIYTLEELEYRHYSELLKDFFAKVIRWKEMLDGYQRDEKRSALSVFRSDDRTTVQAGTSMEMNDPSNKILQVTKTTQLNNPDFGLYQEEFIIRTGREAKHLLIDPEDGKPIEKVRIKIGIQEPVSWRGFEIETERFRDKPGGYFNYRRASFRFIDDSLEVSHKYSWFDIMTDEMAISLLNTIDALIPGSTSHTSQPERRVSKEISIRKALPKGRRARPLRR